MGGLLFKENGGCKGVGEVGDYVTMNWGGGGQEFEALGNDKLGFASMRNEGGQEFEALGTTSLDSQAWGMNGGRGGGGVGGIRRHGE